MDGRPGGWAEGVNAEALSCGVRKPDRARAEGMVDLPPTGLLMNIYLS
jgi:hypothetical protein